MTGLVGRDAELARVRDHLGGESLGAVPVAVVEGEAGIGKTALVEAVAAPLREAGVAVLWARGVPDGGAPPFWLWQQALGHPAGEHEDRFALFEQLRGELIARAPCLLVVDDAQWVDEPSLRALLHAVAHTHDARVAACLTVRTGDRTPGWDAVRPLLLAERGALPVSLGGLRPPDDLAFLSRAAGEALPDALARRACDLAGGNPFFLQELARSWRDRADEALPQTVTDVVRRRVGELSPPAQELLGAASVLGESFELAVAARLVDRPAAACLSAADEALQAGLLRRDGTALRFSHGLVRSALEEQQPLQSVVTLHLRAAEALEELHAADLRPFLADLARHWCATAIAGEREPGVRWAVRAAEAAYASLAWEECARLYDLALKTGGQRLPDDRRAELLVARAQADVPAGRLADAHAACREAVDLATRAGRSDVVARAALALEAIGSRSWDRDVRDWCRAALDDDALAASLRARLLARLTEASIYGGDWEQARHTSEQALALASEGEDDDALVAALRARQLASSGPDRTAERVELADRMITLAAARGRPADELWGLLWRIDAHWEQGRLGDVASDVARLAWCVDRVRTPFAQWHLCVARAALAQGRGEYDDATRFGQQGFALLGALGHPAAFGAYMSLLSLVGHHVGYDPVTVSPPDHAVHAGEVRGELFATIGPAMALAESGRLDEAAHLYARPGPPQGWDVPPYFHLVALGCGCFTACLLGRDDDVRWFRERLEPYRGKQLVGGAGVASFMGPVELALGAASAALGELEAAERDLQEAVRVTRAIGAPGFTVEAECRLAEVLVRAGRPAAARELAQQALATATRLGMRPWEDRLRGLLAERDPLTAREREVAALVAAGRSNREIAQELVLSERTAENHVQHILRKLDLANRSQVAAWVAKRST